MPRRKKRAAWASVSELEPGRRYRIRYWATGPDGQYRRRSETVRGTRVDAERRRAELMLDHSEDAPCPTVRQAWERWALPAYEARVEGGTLSPRSLAQYRSAWACHVEPAWGDAQLDAVRPLRVQQWLSALGATQAAQGVKVLSVIMDHAVRYEAIGHNPMRERYVMPSRSSVTPRDKGVWTLSELGALWARVRGLWWEPAFVLCAFGGCRVGESLGVLAGDVSASAATGGVPVAVVRVERQVDRSGNVSRALKTAESRRVAVVAGRAAERLLSLASAVPPDWFLTHDGLGMPQPQHRLTGSWRSSGLSEHPFRNLRNSWQTWMRWEAGVPPYFIEPLMGHKVGGVTGRHYDRPTPDVLAAAVASAYSARPWDEGWDDLGPDSQSHGVLPAVL